MTMMNWMCAECSYIDIERK